MKLEEIRRNLAILPPHWESRALGPQRAGERQRFDVQICNNSRVLVKLEEIHRKPAILPLHWESASLGPQRACGRQRVNFGIVGSDDVKICINSRILIKLEEIHRNLAILPLCWKSRALGPQLASRRQKGDFGIVGVGLRLNLYK